MPIHICPNVSDTYIYYDIIITICSYFSSQKYLKLLRAYHPDTYMKEKNEKRKKMKEDIFLQIYTKYKNFNNQYDIHKLNNFDESIYENDEDKGNKKKRKKKSYLAKSTFLFIFFF